jgi:hypothetical protein
MSWQTYARTVVQTLDSFVWNKQLIILACTCVFRIYHTTGTAQQDAQATELTHHSDASNRQAEIFKLQATVTRRRLLAV